MRASVIVALGLFTSSSAIAQDPSGVFPVGLIPHAQPRGRLALSVRAGGGPAAVFHTPLRWDPLAVRLSDDGRYFVNQAAGPLPASVFTLGVAGESKFVLGKSGVVTHQSFFVRGDSTHSVGGSLGSPAPTFGGQEVRRYGTSGLALCLGMEMGFGVALPRARAITVFGAADFGTIRALGPARLSVQRSQTADNHPLVTHAIGGFRLDTPGPIAHRLSLQKAWWNTHTQTRFLYELEFRFLNSSG